ncbi:hypothetical protein KPH14_005933 [Odynerus spinipes]|uniref:Dynein regulatory complex protein 1 n=1 Tax=Odynerus spinipes TaxID=1348599 RepID=A0AAD9RJL2_9HYME|nr:hypothetical protein KPH14_005933 [Odynerus spinipes]
MITKEEQSEDTEKERAKELSVTSSDPNIRKLARRHRIQRRLSALQEKGTEDEEVIQRSPIEAQLLACTDIMERVKMESEEVVSNVKVADEARELERRREAREKRNFLLNKLEEENREAILKYQEIDQKWSGILSSKDPLDIHEEMIAQNARCLELLSKKDEVIAELKAELENADVKFVEDTKKQNEDVDILVERIDRQLNVISKAYYQELKNIDEVLDAERRELLDTLEEKWEALYEKLQDDSKEAINKRKEVIREYEVEMARVMTEHHEEYRAQKIGLELENQELQQKVQNMKALCLMNVEKLNYSYTVLKHRDEENTIVKNEQKRRINKLQDTINELRKTYTKLEESTRSEIQKLTDQVLKAHKNILELEVKSENFTNINEKKYFQVWDMNVKRANELVDKILSTDKIIHEQALGLPWKPPEEQLLAKEDLPSYRTAVNAINKEKADAQERRQMPITYKKANTLEDINLERRLLNRIMGHVSEQSNFLIEDIIEELLLPYSSEDNVVIRLDNVFLALNIVSEEEIEFLLNFFLPYTYCPDCTSLDKSTPTSQKSIDKIMEASSFQSTSSTPDVCGDEEPDEDVAQLIATIKDEIYCNDLYGEADTVTNDTQDYPVPSAVPTLSTLVEENVSSSVNVVSSNDKDEKEQKQRLVCKKGHLLQIHSAYVTRALKEFVEKYHFVKRDDIVPCLKDRLSIRKVTVSRSLTVEDIREFWKRYRDLFPPAKERLWDGLLVGLKQYYEILKERQRLSNETEFLKKQNAELRRLLKTYTTQPGSSTRMDTEIPFSTKT